METKAKLPRKLRTGGVKKSASMIRTGKTSASTFTWMMRGIGNVRDRKETFNKTMTNYAASVHTHTSGSLNTDKAVVNRLARMIASVMTITTWLLQIM
jgi:hypothetical protein